MINYHNSLFGFSILFRVHGSAVWKASLPALFSTAVLLIYLSLFGGSIEENDVHRPTQNPYTITVYVTFFSFLLTFRLNFAYQRYWEGATSVQLMLSKWMDVATFLAAFHYQSVQHDKYRPPSFGQHNYLRNLTRERERENNMTKDETLAELNRNINSVNGRKAWWRVLLPGKTKTQHEANGNSGSTGNRKSSTYAKKNISSNDNLDRTRIPKPRTFQEQFSVSVASKNQEEHGHSFPGRRLSLKTLASGLKSADPIDIPFPTLFLQELTHLMSLLTGVALSTLRDDVEGAYSPLAEYYPGQPMPPVNPDELSAAQEGKTWDSVSPVISAAYFLLGLTRGDRHRTLYNAARPFQVLGGVSDMEIYRLQKAHGPYAKVALCYMYVQEFAHREYLNGSAGKIQGPIMSRVAHALSDGMLGYNQARKLAYNPFPFPHAQMTAFFTIAILVIFPLLFYSFVDSLALACILNFVTVLCFLGMNEVAREMENPFRNVPNDLPLTNFQAAFNESLVVSYAGFHPDSWWEVDNDTPNNEGEQLTHPLKS